MVEDDLMHALIMKNTSFIVIACLLTICFMFNVITPAAAKTYRPELSGDYEIGERTYTDLYEVEMEDDTEDELEEEIIDYYLYHKFWLRYKQKLSTTDYYYIKAQYNKKDYREKDYYNSITLDLWTNYTFQINDRLKNKFMIDLRNKDYMVNSDNTYNRTRFKYQLDYKIDDKNDCSIYVQRQWQDYILDSSGDNIYDRFSFSWDRDVNDNLTVNSNIQLDRRSFRPVSESSNKSGRRFKFGFKYKL